MFDLVGTHVRKKVHQAPIWKIYHGQIEDCACKVSGFCDRCRLDQRGGGNSGKVQLDCRRNAPGNLPKGQCGELQPQCGGRWEWRSDDQLRPGFAVEGQPGLTAVVRSFHLTWISLREATNSFIECYAILRSITTAPALMEPTLLLRRCSRHVGKVCIFGGGSMPLVPGSQPTRAGSYQTWHGGMAGETMSQIVGLQYAEAPSSSAVRQHLGRLSWPWPWAYGGNTKPSGYCLPGGGTGDAAGRLAEDTARAPVLPSGRWIASAPISRPRKLGTSLRRRPVSASNRP